MAHTMGWLAFALFALVFVINAAFMLISPTAYLKLPVWLAPRHRRMTEKGFGSGWGAAFLRLRGAFFLAAISWIVYDAFFRHR